MQLNIQLRFPPVILEGGNLKSYRAVMRAVNKGFNNGQAKDQRLADVQYQNTREAEEPA